MVSFSNCISLIKNRYNQDNKFLFMNNRIPFRAWFYFRQGWSTYFAFIFAAINTLTVTYYLAIDKYPFLSSIFPSFVQYIALFVIIGIPVLISIGYIHWKKTGAARAEADISMEVNPYFRRILMNTEIVLPLQIKILELLTKVSANEKLDKNDLDEIKKIQEDLTQHLIQKKTSKRHQLEEDNYTKLKDLDND